MFALALVPVSITTLRLLATPVNAPPFHWNKPLVKFKAADGLALSVPLWNENRAHSLAVHLARSRSGLLTAGNVQRRASRHRDEGVGTAAAVGQCERSAFNVNRAAKVIE